MKKAAMEMEIDLDIASERKRDGKSNEILDEVRHCRYVYSIYNLLAVTPSTNRRSME